MGSSLSTFLEMTGGSTVLPETSVANTGRVPSFSQCCGSRSRDPVPFLSVDPLSGMGKRSRSGSGMNIPDHISESLDTISWVKIT